MHFFVDHKWITAAALVVILVFGIVLWQVLYITHHYTASVEAPNIPRTTESFGTTGPVLNYAILGDSTSIAQGAEYNLGVARQTALSLAKDHQVHLTNYGVSGARVADVLNKQVQKAATAKPDLVLIAIGANDVTHLTGLASIQKNMTSIIATLQSANPNIKIVLTGSPAMGSVSRFAPPTQWLAGCRVRQVNDIMAKVASAKHVVLVPLAAKTAYAFKHHPELFASDNFHPNAAGYALWLPIVQQGIVQTGLAH